ncbi:MAG: Rpn family recombination-promoting nuclease/putative transposase [Planctomycetes bacterium]|nr:Rpn family recombination-promoting nuclease/putative transposase [Planctomycetota bacterium]
MVNPHDALFRATFGEPRNAEGLLRSALPAAIAACIDWSTLTPVPAEFVDPELREHRADLLFSARMLGCEIYLYVLVEHRSTDQRFLAFDMLRYVVRILERHRAEHPEAKLLPMVIPLVVHHGDQPMRAHRRLIRLVELPREPRVLRRWLASHQPELRLIVDDLARVSETQLSDRALGATAFLCLYCLQFVRGRDADEALAAFERVVHRGRGRNPSGLPASALARRPKRPRPLSLLGPFVLRILASREDSQDFGST